MSEYVFKLPDLGEGTVESEIGEWFIKVGDDVKEEDVVGTMMTDKAAVELSSPISGKVIKLAGEPGDVVPVGAALVVFETDAVGAAHGRDQEPVEPAPPVGAAHGRDNGAEAPEPDRAHGALLQDAARRGRVMTSPAIRHAAKQAGVDLHAVPGTGPGGRVTRKDFEAYMAGAPVGAAHGREEVSTGRAHGALLRDRPDTKEIKVIGLRRIIAERMSQATQEIPHFTYVEEIDITELEALRKHLNGKKDDPSQRLTLLPFLGLALIRALREFPQCNSTYDKERNVLVQHGPVHLGVATQTNDGLKVPVVRDADTRTLDGLAAEIRRVSEAARDNSITRGELSGSTTTITSLGKLGGIVSTPVINQPEVGIIGVNRAVERPMVVNGQVDVRLMMNLSSSFDHRFVDGYDAAAMIQRIREMLEHPALIFLPG
ncbi:MAG: dihydrolipoamide acetyltransferase family protein [Woeseiaceae bacterium]|nr:dihydrolipoamide acetyltransferase family protein [Woeseiaceae bacterium]